MLFLNEPVAFDFGKPTDRGAIPVWSWGEPARDNQDRMRAAMRSSFEAARFRVARRSWDSTRPPVSVVCVKDVPVIFDSELCDGPGVGG